MEDSPLKWRVGPTGQHIEMGIAEMNLVLLLGQLGLTWDFQRERLLPDRHALRPVRDARARRDRLLDLLGLALRPRRHAVRHLALARGRRPPVALDTRDRDRDAGTRRTPSRATRASSSGCCSTRSRRMQDAGRRGALPAPLDEADRPGAVRRAPSSARRGAAARRRRRRRLPPARARRRATIACCSPPAARSCPRRSRPPTLLADEEASRRPCSASPRPTGSTATGSARRTRRCAAHAARRRRTSSGSCSPDERGLPVVTVIDGASHALAFVGCALGVRVRPARRRPLRPDRQPAGGLRRVRHRRRGDR